MLTGRRRCSWGSYHLQKAHTSDHCDGRTSCRTVMKPNHRHCQSSLQSVWAVGRYLSWYSVAGVAFWTLGTCKQCMHQTTAICDGAQGTTLLWLNTHAACANAPERYLAYDPVKIRAQNRLSVSVRCIEVVPVNQRTSQHHKSARGQLTRQCYRTPLIGIEGVSLLQDALEAQAMPALHKQKLFPPELILAKARMGRGSSFRKRKPANKACAGLCWCIVPVPRLHSPE